MDTLKIENLTVTVDNKKILRNFNLEIKSGQIHVLMGPNGIGKSTLVKVIMGDPNYKIENGNIYFNKKLVNEMTIDERSRLGIFLGMQLPPEIEGVSNADFLRSAISIREKDNFKLFEFIKSLDTAVENLQMDSSMIHRGINQGFSGGERKKNEILQMYLLNPKVIMLDEIDSGLDVDSLKIVGNNVMNYFKTNNPGILLITHYKKLLDYIKPTHVHIIDDGKIVKSGGYNLVDEVEKYGFKEVVEKKYISIGTCAIREKMKNE